MANNISIPRANPLRFVRTDNYYSITPNKPNLYNRFLEHETWQIGDTKNYYYLKFNITDPIYTQFTTNYETIKITVYTDLNVIVDSITIVGVTKTVAGAGSITMTVPKVYTDTSGNRAIQFKIDTTLMSGNYYVCLELSGAGRPNREYQSEFFEVGDYDELTYITWYGSDTDGIFYDLTQIFGIRIEAFFAEVELGTNSEIYENYNKASIMLRSISTRDFLFYPTFIPRYITELLSIGLSHETVYMNDMLVVAKDKPNITYLDKSNLYEYKQTFSDVEYEQYEALVDEGGVAAVSNTWAYSDTAGDIVRYSDITGDNILLY